MDTGAKNQELTLLEISEGGSKIVLKDGSKWKIAPYFKVEVFDYWRHGDKVRIRDGSDDPAYSWTIFNLDENLEVAAKRIN
jgi:hypothetical protein